MVSQRIVNASLQPVWAHLERRLQEQTLVQRFTFEVLVNGRARIRVTCGLALGVLTPFQLGRIWHLCRRLWPSAASTGISAVSSSAAPSAAASFASSTALGIGRTRMAPEVRVTFEKIFLCFFCASPFFTFESIFENF